MSEGKSEENILFPSLEDKIKDSVYCTKKMFLYNFGERCPEFSDCTKLKLSLKMNQEYKSLLKGNEKEHIDFATDIDNITKNFEKISELDHNVEAKEENKQKSQTEEMIEIGRAHV